MLRQTMLIAILFGVPVQAQDAAEVAVAREVLASLQDLSFRKRREYCGFIGYNAAGELVASPATAGTQASCGAPFPDDLAVVASYHTHGAFDHGYFNEIPSDVDMESDAEFLLNGYVSTPGGRLWYIDGRAWVARQICGVGCLPVAPGFRKGLNGAIAERYTFDELVQKLND
ncbi:DUF4329 domain-containing protein [Yoonia sp. R2331]|uniref:DUF4329 domain-containing protein n=1 Tax=Yoonia sp. R2331 TaxID=3237238 RepID=UPI0034E4FFF6